MDTFERLSAAGLSKKEAAVYASLLEHGQQSMTALHRSTQIHRPALYEVVPALERKGLVSRVKVRNRHQFIAESPERLAASYEERAKQEIADLKELANEYATFDPNRPIVKYFEGERALSFVFDDVLLTLPVGGEFYRYSSRLDIGTKAFENSRYAKERDSRRIERLVITSQAKAKRKHPKLERAVRAIPEDFDLFEDNISLLIYGNKTAYIDYGSKTSFIIESEKVARFQKKLFMLLWKHLR